MCESPAGAPYLERQRTSDFYIHLHFLHFAKLYNSERAASSGVASREALAACRLHLQVTFALCPRP